MPQEFYRTDLKENAIDDLEKLSKFLELAKQDKSYWKWVIIALHSSLYKFMLLVLKNPDCSGIWEEKDGVEKVKKEKVGLVWKIKLFDPDNWLVSFLKAFERIQNQTRVGRYVPGKPFVSDAKVNEAMKRLNTELRNQFLHFKPKSWLIEISEIKKIIQTTLPIIRFIIFKNRIRILIEEKEQLAINNMLKKIILRSRL